MFKASAPIPNTIWPRRMVCQLDMNVPYHVIIYPIVIKIELIINNFFYPYLSAKTPPTKGQNKFVIEQADEKMVKYLAKRGYKMPEYYNPSDYFLNTIAEIEEKSVRTG